MSRKYKSRAAKHSVAPKPFVSNPYNQERIAAHHDAVAAAPWLSGMATPEPAAAPTPRLRMLCVLGDAEADHKVLDHFDDAGSEASYDADWTDSDVRRSECLVVEEAAKRRRVIAEQKLAARLASVQIVGVDINHAEEDGPIDDVHSEVKVGGQWAKVADYDLVFLDNETPSVRCLAAGLPPSRVAFVANVKAEQWDGEGQRRRQVVPATLTAILRRVSDLVADRRRQLVMPWSSEPAYPPAPSSDDAAVDEAIVRFAQA